MALADHERVREDGGIFAFDPVEDFDRFFHDEILRHADEDAGDRTGAMECGEFGRTQFRFLRHEVLLHKVGVLGRRLFEGNDDKAGFGQIRGGRGGGKKAVVAEDKAGGGFAEYGGAFDQRRGIGHRAGIAEAVERDRFDIGEAPFLILRRGQRELLEVLPAASARGDEPFGPLAFDERALHQGDAGNG